MNKTGVLPLVLSLASPDATLEATGGKGMSLAKMLAAGLPVPDGFHVTTAAYRRFVDENALQPRIMQTLDGVDPADPAALEAASRAISGLFAQAQTPPDIEAAITEAYAALDNAPVAVRSSATAEDLPGASFAGQQETYLNIRGDDALLAAVKQCWASLWTARAIAYRLKNQIDQTTVALAVVVQELVAADAAGILFTANPVNGKRDELLINAAWGLGEAVVSGAVTPDTLTVEKATGRILHQEIAEKLLMTVRTDGGTREAPVPDSQKHKAVLSAAQTAELARIAVRIEQLYQMPMDVEWALVDGKFYIVQARPITALPPDWSLPDPKALYSRSSLAEHTPSPVSPLFATFGLEIANRATAKVWERYMGKNAPKLIPAGGIYQTLNGYIYLAIRMRGQNLLSLLKMGALQMGPILRGSVARWRSAREEFAAVVEEWERRPVDQLAHAQLLAGVRALFGAACRYYTVVQTTLPAAQVSEIVFTRFYDSLIRRKQDPPAVTFLLGSDTVALRAEKSLFDIAEWAKANPPLADYLLQHPSEQLAADLRQATPPETLPAEIGRAWRQRFQRHLDEFGRTAYEFDFAHPTPQETPGPLLDTVKAYLAGSAGSPYERQREMVEKRDQATQAVLARVGQPRKGWFLRLLRWAQEAGPLREDSIFDMGMAHPLIRRMWAELGRRLAAGGAIGQVEDIYWLEKSEVEAGIAALERGAPLPNFAERIHARSSQWRAALKIDPPVLLPEKSGWSKLMHGSEAEHTDGKVVLKGVGTSGGTITAPARVLFGPEDFAKLQPGDVLVAVTTTPAWTPLFAMASAVVTDIGGPLSHSSIVAREYGIPAVMAARTATRSIQSGQVVTVDGNAGTVTLEG